MPKLRMSSGQQLIYEELVEFSGGARMINAPDLAKFWGRDVRCIRDWLGEHKLSRYRLGNGYGYMIRDVSYAIWLEQEVSA